MELYGVILKRTNELIPFTFAETYNEFALKRINEEELQRDKPIKVYSHEKFEKLMLLLASYIYFNDIPTICEVYNFKCAFLLKHPEYIVNKKNKIVNCMEELISLLKKPEFKQFAGNPNCLFLPYCDFIQKLYMQSK